MMSNLKEYPSRSEYFIKSKANSESENAGINIGILFFAAIDIILLV